MVYKSRKSNNRKIWANTYFLRVLVMLRLSVFLWAVGQQTLDSNSFPPADVVCHIQSFPCRLHWAFVSWEHHFGYYIPAQILLFFFFLVLNKPRRNRVISESSLISDVIEIGRQIQRVGSLSDRTGSPGWFPYQKGSYSHWIFSAKS